MTSNPWLTLILVNDAIKPAHFLHTFFDALRAQGEKLVGVQLIIINQSQSKAEIHEAALGFDYTVWQCDHEFVGGYPIWDLMSDLKRMQPIVAAPYQMVVHKECVFSFGYFDHLRETLQENSPVICVGNMRKVGATPSADGKRFDLGPLCASESEKIIGAIRLGTRQLADALREVTSCHWHHCYSDAEYAKFKRDQAWLEDVFIASSQWLRRMNFYGQEPNMFFQDIYDCMREVFKILGHTAPKVLYPDPKDLCIYHLHHAKDYYQFCPEIAAYFSHPRWAGLSWQSDLYQKLVEERKRIGYISSWADVIKLKSIEGGTLTRYCAKFADHLAAVP